LNVDFPGVTWRGDSIDDIEILSEIPSPLVDLLSQINGFILYSGALHVRGASTAPDWHSLRAAWHGRQAFHRLYGSILSTDVPFAQDQFGDQFLIRNGTIIRLAAETGEIESIADNIGTFFDRVRADIVGFLNVGIDHPIQPGQLIVAYPPFCCKESGAGASLQPAPAREVISGHADFAKQLSRIPAGGRFTVRVVK
jgi:hypothetical protein